MAHLSVWVGQHGVYVDPVSGGDPHDVHQVLGEVVRGREELIPIVMWHYFMKVSIVLLFYLPRQLKVGPCPHSSAIHLQIQLQEPSISPESRPVNKQI